MSEVINALDEQQVSALRQKDLITDEQRQAILQRIGARTAVGGPGVAAPAVAPAAGRPLPVPTPGVKPPSLGIPRRAGPATLPDQRNFTGGRSIPVGNEPGQTASRQGLPSMFPETPVAPVKRPLLARIGLGGGGPAGNDIPGPVAVDAPEGGFFPDAGVPSLTDATSPSGLPTPAARAAQDTADQANAGGEFAGTPLDGAIDQNAIPSAPGLAELGTQGQGTPGADGGVNADGTPNLLAPGVEPSASGEEAGPDDKTTLATIMQAMEDARKAGDAAQQAALENLLSRTRAEMDARQAQLDVQRKGAVDVEGALAKGQKKIEDAYDSSDLTDASARRSMARQKMELGFTEASVRRQAANNTARDAGTARKEAIALAQETAKDEERRYSNTTQELEQELADKKIVDYWADKSMGNRLMAALAIGMGAYAASMNGGPNTALQIIQGQIERDVDRQKFEFEKAQGKLRRHDSLYGRIWEKRDRDRAAANEEYGAVLDKVSMDYQTIGFDLDMKKDAMNLALTDEQLSRQVRDEAVSMAMRDMQLTVEGIKANTASQAVQADADVLSSEFATRQANLVMNLEEQRAARRQNNEQFVQSQLMQYEKMAQDQTQFETSLAANEHWKNVDAVLELRKIIGTEKTNALKGIIAYQKSQGGNLPNAAKMEIATIDGTRNNLRTLHKEYNDVNSTGYDFITNYAKSYIPGTDADVYDKKAEFFATELLKAMQGSRPSDFDMKFYMKRIPRSYMINHKAEDLFGHIDTMLNNRKQAILDAYSAGGQSGMDEMKAYYNEVLEVTNKDGTVEQVTRGTYELAQAMGQVDPSAKVQATGTYHTPEGGEQAYDPGFGFQPEKDE